MRRPLFAVLIAFSVVTPAAGEPLTLAQALERARATSPRLDQLEALREAAAAGLAGARGSTPSSR